MELKLWQKNILYMLIIIGVGFVLFNVAFILAGIVHVVYRIAIIPLIKNFNHAKILYVSWHYFYIIFVLLISWLIFRKQFNNLVKATFSTLPMIVILTEVGIQFYHWSVLVWIIGTIIVGLIFLYLYKTKRSWLYYFATIYV